jgi:adenylate cyclase
MLGFSKSRSESLKLAEECAQKALDLNESHSNTLLLLGRIWSLRGDFDKAIAYQERAVEASPNDSVMHLSFAFTLDIAGMHERAIQFNKKVMRLSPHFPAVCLRTAAYASFFARHYDEALKAGEELLGRAKKGEYPSYWAYFVLAATYIELGQEEKARAYVNELLKHDPSCRAERFQKAYPMKNEAETERFLSALRKAGLN